MFKHGLRVSEFAQAHRNHVKLEDKRIKIMRLNGSRSTEHPLSGNAIKRDVANRPENQAARRRRSDSASRKPAAWITASKVVRRGLPFGESAR